MLDFYERADFKLFPCNLDKTPRVESWRASSAHLSKPDAQKIMDSGHFVGAWLPCNYIVIDVDRGHKDNGDGIGSFRNLSTSLGITTDLFTTTLVVKTGSGGYHLYFTLPPGVDYRELSQKSIAPSVDVRTHLGYVIAAGTNGYTPTNTAQPMEIPTPLLERIRTRNKDKAKDYIPPKQLPFDLLQKVLERLDPLNFNTNDTWQELITSAVAAAGNSAEVITALESWSRKDPQYLNDISIRKRIETFEPDGGITVGTFIHILKQQSVSKYLVDKVRVHVGAEFSFSESFSELYDPPFPVDIREHQELMKAFYYSKHQTAGVSLVAALSKQFLLYSVEDHSFFYFNGHRWVELQGVLDIIFSVLLNVGMRWYSDTRKKDADADEYISAYISFIGSLAIMQRFESALKQHPDIARTKVPWDAPELEATLTLEDSVMDFTKKGLVTFRKGLRNEYRRLYLDLYESDFKNQESPEAFRALLKDIFPDVETRKTATYALASMIGGTGRFRKFQIWNGAGSNGKSTLMELMKFVIGQRAISYKADILLSKANAQSLTPELAAFRGALVGFSSETEESKRIAQGAVKSLTGNETITANPKYKGVIEFKTTFQLVLATNYLPSFSAHDAAFINRLLILPFYTCFYSSEEEKERAESKGSRYFKVAKDPLEEVKQERAQILLYLAKRYQELENTLPESGECLEAKRHYVDDNNDIVKFLTEFVEYSDEKNWFTPTKDLVDFYNEENNSRYSSKFVIMRLKELYPLVEAASKMLNGKLTRGVKHIRLKVGAYPEGYTGNHTKEELGVSF